ncbi:hypothetical protein DH2020_018131 [Rehmannia glutinosa]|uniref:Transcription initiation factor TFIID subunit 2 n=1 Tax=Rehmannia glutinosa TaxID=99300 RepID=A0ABR0WJF4_REHGL
MNNWGVICLSSKPIEKIRVSLALDYAGGVQLNVPADGGEPKMGIKVGYGGQSAKLRREGHKPGSSAGGATSATSAAGEQIGGSSLPPRAVPNLELKFSQSLGLFFGDPTAAAENLRYDVEMAKAKKGKNEDQRGGDNSNSEAVVKHQKLCLSIDMDNRRIYGYTELQIVVPDNGIVGLHADNLAIEKVTVDGDPAEFGVFPHCQHLDPKDRWCVVSSANSAADASGSVKITKTDNKQEEYPQMDNGEPLSAGSSREVQNVKHVRIEYWVEKTETGIHFNDNVLHTDNQLRRARCWFPCLDDNLQCCCYDLEFTVASNLVAVSSGTLLHQTYVYKLDVPVAAQWISLAVAPFEILPDRHGGVLSHFCLPSNLSKLRNTVVFSTMLSGNYLILMFSVLIVAPRLCNWSHYEDYLSAPFPFGSYKQVFIAPEMTVSSWSMGASISIFSSHLLFDEKLIDQTIETRIKLADALARQWFGVYITPEAPNDGSILINFAPVIVEKSQSDMAAVILAVRVVVGWSCQANCAVCQADDSGATALSSAPASKDLYGTQCIGFYGKIRSWKSVAVLQMLEKQMGPESFRKGEASLFFGGAVGQIGMRSSPGNSLSVLKFLFSLILQNIVQRARDSNRSLRTMSTKEHGASLEYAKQIDCTYHGDPFMHGSMGK